MVIGCSGSKVEASDWVVYKRLLGRGFPEAISMSCKAKVVKLILLSYTLSLPLSLDLVNCNPQWCPGQKAGSPRLLCLPHFTYLSSVQSLSHLWLFATPWTEAHQASLSITNSRSLLKLMAIELVMPSNHLILCRSLLLLYQGLFQWVGSSYQGAKVLEFQLQHQSFQWIFMTDFL